MQCVSGDFRSHGSSSLFSIGKYPFFIYKIELKNFTLKKRKSLEKSRLFAAISFLSPFDGLPERIQNRAKQVWQSNCRTFIFEASLNLQFEEVLTAEQAKPKDTARVSFDFVNGR